MAGAHAVRPYGLPARWPLPYLLSAPKPGVGLDICAHPAWRPVPAVCMVESPVRLFLMINWFKNHELAKGQLFARIGKGMKNICIYCGSTDRAPKVYLEAAYTMGAALAGRGLRLVYGGGGTGLMGALANGVLQHGGEVVGVIPAMFNTPALVHTALTRLEVTEDMHTRKARMAALADGFIALPGGFGTFEELFEALTWSQIGLHRKPIGLLNVQRYYDPLISLVEHAIDNGFIYGEHKRLFFHQSEVETLLDELAAFEFPQGIDRWVTRDQSDTRG